MEVVIDRGARMSKNISVIIPVIEDNTYLLRCINMLQRQTVLPMEIIVADQNVEIKGICGDNVFCLSDGEGLIPLKKNPELEYIQKDFFEHIFDEERRIATNINRALELANGEYIYFCNVTSMLSNNVLEMLFNNNSKEEPTGVNVVYLTGKEYIPFDNREFLWGKLFAREELMNNKLTKWNYLDILKWVRECKTIGECKLCDKVYLYDESYDAISQKVFTVKIKDNVNKYKEIFMKRIREGQDLFENINTYDYVKVNVVTSLVDECINNPDLLLELTYKYILPIYENKINAKKNRKELLHKALCDFFVSIEADEKQYECILLLFGMNRQICDVFKIYNFESFEKIYQHWNKLNF